MAMIGFIGLGHMGLPMATNLLKAGYRVRAFDLQSAVMQHWQSLGGLAAEQLADFGPECDVIVTMLQTC